MIKIILRLIPAIIVAWILSPLLNEIFPLFEDWSFLDITDWSFAGIANWFVNLPQNALFGLRLIVWGIGIYVLFIILPPVFKFIAPLSARYAITKPHRRIQGYLGEALLALTIFALTNSLLALVPLSVNLASEINSGSSEAVALPELLPAPGTDSAPLQAHTMGLGVTSFKENPLAYLKPAFGQTFNLALYLSLFLYGLTLIPSQWLPVKTKGRTARYIIGKKYEKLWRLFRQGKYGQGGSATFGNLLDEWGNEYAPASNDVFLGLSLYKSSLRIGVQSEQHFLTIAGTRAGKGIGVILQNLYRWKSSAIIIDIKGENAYWTARWRQDVLGHKVIMLDPFKVITRATNQFNPLESLSLESDTLGEDIQVIAQSMVIRPDNEKEPHWNDGAETIICGCIDYLISSGRFENPTLIMIRELLEKTGNERTALIDDMLNLKRGAGLAREAAARILRGEGTQEIAGILSNADKHTQWLGRKSMRRVLIPQEKDRLLHSFNDLKEQPTTVYIIVPGNYLHAHKRFVRMIISMAINHIASTIEYEVEGKNNKHPVLFLMDEFLSLGYLAEVERAFNLMAGYGMILWPFVQSLAGLEKQYGKASNVFITNSAAVQVFGVSDPLTTGWVSEMIGTHQVRDSLFSQNKSIHPLRKPEEVATDVVKASFRQYIIRNGLPPMLTEILPYYKDKQLLKKSYKRYRWPQERSALHAPPRP